jgi:hypothetical protein
MIKLKNLKTIGQSISLINDLQVRLSVAFTTSHQLELNKNDESIFLDECCVPPACDCSK